MGPSGRGLGKKNQHQTRSVHGLVLFLVLVRCFSPGGSRGSRHGRGMHWPLPGPIRSPSPAARAPAAPAPSPLAAPRELAPQPAPPSPLVSAIGAAGKTMWNDALPRKRAYDRCFGKALISGVLYHHIDPTVDALQRTQAHIWGLDPISGWLPCSRAAASQVGKCQRQVSRECIGESIVGIPAGGGSLG